jgi:hypothetical protein
MGRVMYISGDLFKNWSGHPASNLLRKILIHAVSRKDLLGTPIKFQVQPTFNSYMWNEMGT